MLKLIKQFFNKKILHKEPSPRGPLCYISAESFYNTYKWYICYNTYKGVITMKKEIILNLVKLFHVLIK